MYLTESVSGREGAVYCSFFIVYFTFVFHANIALLIEREREGFTQRDREGGVLLLSLNSTFAKWYLEHWDLHQHTPHYPPGLLSNSWDTELT